MSVFRRVFVAVLAALAIVLSPLAVVAAHAATSPQDDTATVNQGCAVSIDVLANDGAPAGETVSIVTDPAFGDVVVNADNTVTLDLGSEVAAAQSGSLSFTYQDTAPDGTTSDGTATVTVTVNPLVVSACDNTYTVEPNTPEPINVMKNGYCPGQCEITVISGPTHGTLATIDPLAYPGLTYTSTAGYTGQDSVTYELSDGSGNTSQATATFDIARRGPADATFSAVPKGITAAWTNPLSGDFTQTVLRYTLDTDNAVAPQTPTDGDGGAVFLAPAATGTISGLTPGATYLVSVFSVYSDAGFEGPASSTPITLPANNPPTVTNKTVNTTVNTAAIVNVATGANDPDGDTLTYTTPNDAAHGNVTCTTDGSCTYTPATDYTGPDSFTFVADDGFGGTATGTVTVTVTSTAVVPTVSAGSWGPASRATAKVVTIKATVGSVSSGQVVALQRKTGSTWSNAKAKVIGTAGAYILSSPRQPSGKFSYRVAVEDSAHTVLVASSAKTLSFYTASLRSVVKKGHEAVTIKNTGRVSINLKGWTITAKHGKTVTLPKFTLKAGKSVRVHLTKGKTTGKVIYVNKSKCFGDKHDTLTLRDTKAAGHSVVNTRTY